MVLALVSILHLAAMPSEAQHLQTPLMEASTAANNKPWQIEGLCQERSAILRRSYEWLQEHVKYNFNKFRQGDELNIDGKIVRHKYRTQCSGFVSEAWNIPNPDPNDTPRCYNLESRQLAVVINKDELR